MWVISAFCIHYFICCCCWYQPHSFCHAENQKPSWNQVQCFCFLSFSLSNAASLTALTEKGMRPLNASVRGSWTFKLFFYAFIPPVGFWSFQSSIPCFGGHQFGKHSVLCGYFCFCNIFCLFFFSPSDSRPPTPQSDSELVSKSTDRSGLKDNPHMHWAWGELPQAAKVSSISSLIPASFSCALIGHVCLIYCRLMKMKWILVLCKITVFYVR